MSTPNISGTADRPSDPAVEAASAGRFIPDHGGRSESKRRRGRPQQPRGPPDMVGAYSIPDFCAAHGGMSEAFFHKLQKDGRGPTVMRVGNRTMISIESAAAWRKAREASND